jgi:hypothetical protein
VVRPQKGCTDFRTRFPKPEPERESTHENIHYHRRATTGLGLSLASFALAADESFIGKWKLNPDKSQLSGLTYKVEDAGSNQMKFVFGDDVETVSTDGKPHTTKYGNTWLVTKSGPNGWHWVTKRDGKTTSDAMWTVSEDGATSSYVNTETRPDSSTSHDVITLKRTAGTSGLVGTWESTEIKIGSPNHIEMAAWGKDGYSLKTPVYKGQTDFKLDGKDYTPKGPQVPKGMTVSAKKVDDRTVELTYKLKDKTIETDRWELSADGKTLTNTVDYSGLDKKEVDVFDRQ